MFSKAEFKLLAFLLRNSDKSMYGREIAKKSGISLGKVHQALKKFVKQGFIAENRKGNQHFYSVDTKNVIVKQFKILFNLLDLKDIVKELSDYSKKIVLFGSCASGTDHSGSDIDLFVLAEDKSRVRAILENKKTERKINPLILTGNEFYKIKSRDKALYYKIIEGMELYRGNKDGE